MKGSLMLRRVQHVLVKNSPAILSAVAITGVVSTAYFAARAGAKASVIIRKDEEEHGAIAGRKERAKHHAKLVWKEFIPPVTTGVVTIGALVGSAKVSNKRTSAAHAAFALTERAYSEYREKVIEELGERKDQIIRDEIAEKRVHANPPSATIISGPGNVLLCELMTGRYFTGEIESLRRAMNQLNEKLLKRDRMTLDDWYHEIGLRSTSISSDFGWESDKLMDLSFTPLMTEDGRPCLAFEYNYITPIHFH